MDAEDYDVEAEMLRMMQEEAGVEVPERTPSSADPDLPPEIGVEMAGVAESVGRSGASLSAESASDLAKWLRDPRPAVQVGSLKLLEDWAGGIEDPELILALVALLDTEDTDVRNKIGAVLSAVGPDHRKSVIERLQELFSTSTESRVAGLKLIARMGAGWNELSNLVTLCFRDENEAVRREAVFAAKEFRSDDEDLLDGLWGLLEDSTPIVRCGAVSALAKFGQRTPEVLACVSDLLVCEDIDARASALFEIDLLGEDAVTQDILKGIETCLGDSDLRCMAAGQLESLGPGAATKEILDAVVFLMREESRVVGTSGDTAATESSEITWILLRTLKAWGERAATGEVLEVLSGLLASDASLEIKEGAIGVWKAFGQAVSSLSLLVLFDCLRGEDDMVALEAAEAIKELFQAEISDEILARSVNLLRGGDTEVRRRAVSLLVELPGPNPSLATLNTLADLLSHEDINRSSSAAFVLKKWGSAAVTQEVLAGLGELLTGDSRRRLLGLNLVAALGDAALDRRIVELLFSLLEDIQDPASGNLKEGEGPGVRMRLEADSEAWLLLKCLFKGYIRISQRDEVGEGAVVPGMGARLECAEPLRNLLRDVYVSDGKEDHIVECVECAESAGSVLDDLDDSVEAFGDGVGKTRVHECEDAEEVLSQGPDELSQGFKSTSECGRRPAFQEAFGSPGRFVFPELLELVLESPGSIDSVVRLLQCFECPSIPSGACR